MRCVVMATVIMLTIATGARGGFSSGNDLYANCTSRGELFTACIDYVKGVLDAGAAEGSYFDSNTPPHYSTIAGFRWCLPDITLGQAVDVAIRFLRDNPERRHVGAAGLVAHAMESGWPCPSARQLR
jgi:hypothetical protein